jgi:thiosulfate dehydrogenase [quinone] large subunit
MNTDNFHSNQRSALTLLRLLIGWHFLYEAAVKIFNPNWTAKYYLLSAESFTKPFFTWLAGDGLIGMVDFMNILILAIVGLTLVLGVFERLGALLGIVLLLLYYFAHPAFPGASQAGTEGSYFLINKNLIEAAALYVIYLCPTGQYFGLRGLMSPASLKTSNT